MGATAAVCGAIPMKMQRMVGANRRRGARDDPAPKVGMKRGGAGMAATAGMGGVDAWETIGVSATAKVG